MDNYLLFLNARATIDEQHAILLAANSINFKVIYLNNKLPEYLKNYVEIHYKREGDLINQALEIAKNYNIKGVFSFNDTDVESAAIISSKLNIPGVDPEKIILARNKYLMRDEIAKHDNTLVPKYYLINEDKDIPDINFPAVIKPISSAGSKGIFIVNNRDELLNAYQNLKDISKNDVTFTKYGKSYILEEYIEGQEFSVEGVVVNNKLHIAGITDKQTTDPWCLEYRQIFPANYENTQQIKDFAIKIVKVLRLNNCPIHLEAKMHNNSLKLVEIAARTGGDCISTHLISNSLGINWVATILDSIVNQKEPNLAKNYLYISGIEFKLANKEYRFNGFNYKESFNQIPGILMSKELVKRGSLIKLPPKDFTLQKLGFVMTYAKDFENVAKNLNQAIENISINYE